MSWTQKYWHISLVPKPTERQKVSTCCHAQLNYLDIHDVEGVQDTFIFMKKVIYMMENLNCWKY